MRHVYHIQRSKGEFSVVLLEESWRSPVADILDQILNVPFGHRFTWNFILCNALFNWAAKHEKEFVTVPITEEQAIAASEAGTWDWDKDDA